MYSKQGQDIENPTINDVFTTIKNKAKYYRENEGAVAGQALRSGGGFDNLYPQMTDNEYAIYNYYLAKEKTGELKEGTAEEYFKDLEDTLKARKAEERFKVIEGNTGLEYLLVLKLD